MSKNKDIKKDQIVPVRLSKAEKTFLREELDKMADWSLHYY
jgi:hypothetical protein